MHKQAIAVFNPSDPVEKAVQDAFHQMQGGWLASYPCRAFARAIESMKIFDSSWLQDPNLLEQRISYFFQEHMIARRDTMVFPTHMLFFRDILENNEINGYLHDPIVFLATPIAHYLFAEYPIHMFFDMSKIKEASPGVEFIEIGGMTLVDGMNVSTYNALLKVVDKTDDKEDTARVASQLGYHKVGSTEVSRGVFMIDQHERGLRPESRIYDKRDRSEGMIGKVEAGETGQIEIVYDDGRRSVIPQEEFDALYIVTGG